MGRYADFVKFYIRYASTVFPKAGLQSLGLCLLYSGAFPTMQLQIDGCTYVLNRKTMKRPLLFTIEAKKSHVFNPNRDLSEVSFVKDGKTICLRGADAVCLAKEVFFDGEYALLDVKGKVVVDIGANIGDTAIYFSGLGAEKVLAFEPYPYSYDAAKLNLRLNSVRNVELFNAAVTGRNGSITLYEGQTDGATALKESGSGKSVPTMTLDAIARKFRLNSAILKVDCEGSEKEIFETAGNDTLARFSEIMVETNYAGMVIGKLTGAGLEAVKIKENMIYARQKKANRRTAGVIQ